MLLSIAWRNLWRSRRRTVLTLSAVSFGLIGMLAMTAMMQAMGDRMVEALIGSSTGHIQVHREAYRTDQQFTLTVTDAQGVLDTVRATKGVVAASGRIYGVAHAAFVRGEDEAVRSGGGEDIASPVVGLYGVEPSQEILVTDLNERVDEGRWLESETEVVIGASLAKRNNIRIGDAMLPTAVASTGAMQGPWAVSDEVPRVVGIIRTGVDEIDGRVVVMTTDYLAKLVRLEGQVHEVAIRAEDPEKLAGLTETLRAEVIELRSKQRPDEAFDSTSDLHIARENEDGQPPGSDTPTIRLVGITLNDIVEGEEVQQTDGLASGHFPLRAEDIAIHQSLAKRLGVAAGDRVTVAVPIDCGDPELPCPPSSESFQVTGLVDNGDELAEFGLVASSVVGDNIKALAPELVSTLSGEQAAHINARVGQLRGEAEVRDEILPWSELQPALAQMVEMMDTAPMIFLIIIYIAVVFIIANTMLMATFERLREFGVMRAIGMRPTRVIALVITESFLLSIVGVAIGLVVVVPLILYWQAFGMNTGVFMEGESYEISGVVFDPILWPTLDVYSLFSASLAVIVLTSLAGVYPAVRAALVNPIDALRNEMTPFGRQLLLLIRSLFGRRGAKGSRR